MNATTLENGTTLDADLCIIGAGAAGITIAREFLGSPVTVCLLEGGQLESDIASQLLYASIQNIGRNYPYLQGSRLRYFGGSTNHWGGHCVPLRAVNFEKAPWSRYSGWPISLADLAPFYRRAETLLGIDTATTDPATVFELLRQDLFPFDSTRIETQVSRYHRVRFGQTFRQDLAASSNVKVVLGANVTSIEAHPDGERVDTATVRSLDGRGWSVRAKAFVLATGGIENPRLLLASRSVQRNGLGNQHDLVGRFFMEHISYHKGVILPASTRGLVKLYTSEMAVGFIAHRAHLVLPEKVVRDAQIPDFRTELHAIPYTVNEGIRSARALHRSFERMEWPDQLFSHVANIIRNANEVISHDDTRPSAYLLLNNVEQAPNPSSRVSLTERRDSLGMPIASIDWQLSDIDKQGIRFAHARIAEEVGRTGFGRFFNEMPAQETEILSGADGACHHMGTTRMSDDPRAGVVDKHCRVHGIRNLYVAGSSVFPTGGYANPTFTIVALALRLADHLRSSHSR